MLCVPNANYIPQAHVGAGIGYMIVRVGFVMVRVGSKRIFRYQHVGIGNVKCSHWGVYANMSPKCEPIRVIVEYRL